MMFSLSLGLALFSSTAFAAVHDIKVGTQDGQLKFDPEAIGAAVGDQVVFHFYPKNHSVVQSSFASPCGPKDGGLNSGFMPVAANSTDEKPTWTITINDTQPFWAYCSQAANTPMFHCGQGMVFSVNCGPDGAPNSFTNFKQSALKVGEQLKAQGSGGASAGSNTWTAAYGGYTVPPVSDAQVVTQTVTLGSSTWTTTYSSYPGSPAPTPAAEGGQVHQVTVGGSSAGLVFSPNSIQAAPRDTVQFVFKTKNHTVTQSTFADPCRAMSGGFDSSFMAVSDDNQPMTWNLTVNDTNPIWAYCKQKTPTSHCGAGMVFAINAVENSARNFSAYQALAKNMNGTAAAAAANPSSTTPNGAANVRASAGVVLSLVAAAAFLL